MSRLRLAVTLPGAASLGTFEAGALAALLVAVQAIQAHAETERQAAPVVVDAIAGTSAGALNGLIAARVLTAALDPVRLLWRAWVEEATIRRLRTASPHSPLSLNGLASAVAELLDQQEATRVPAARPQVDAVRLRISLCCLRGLRYEIADINQGQAIPALTFRDWSDFRFTPRGSTLTRDQAFAEFTEPRHASALEVAIASASSPLAFGPRLLNRRVRHEDCQAIRSNRVAVPRDGWLWYSDGGLVNNEPLGHAVRLAKIADDDAPARRGETRRAHLVIHPAPSHDSARLYQLRPGRWMNAARRPAWCDTLLHASRIALSQSIYEDLRAVVRDNKRLRWKEQFVAVMADTLTDEQRRRLAGLYEEIQQDRRRLRDLRSARIGSGAAGPPPAGPVEHEEDTLRCVMDALSGAYGRAATQVMVLSPGTEAADAGLCGGKLGHFGGFLDRDDRINDFVAGYEQGLRWLGQDQSILTCLGDDYRAAGLASAQRARPTAVAERVPVCRRLARRAALVRLGAKLATVLAVEKVGRISPLPKRMPTPRLDCPDGSPE